MKSDKLFTYCINRKNHWNVYNNIINQCKYKMNTIYMNSKNSKTSESHVLTHNHTDKMDLWRDEKRVALSNLSIYYT